MRRVPIWCELVCRTCATGLLGESTYGPIRRASMVRQAKRAGVRFAYDEVFCDDKCKGKFEEEKRDERL